MSYVRIGSDLKFLMLGNLDITTDVSSRSIANKMRSVVDTSLASIHIDFCTEKSSFPIFPSLPFTDSTESIDTFGNEPMS